MPRISLSKEFKEALSDLPDREKDKLLFRLVAKDVALVARLEYELLEGAETKKERRQDIEQDITLLLERYDHYFYSPGYLLLELRSISGDINRHVKTTKDKYGEIALNLLMLNTAFERFGTRIAAFPAYKARTFNNYVVKRAIKLEKLLDNIHEDYQMDFHNDWEQLCRYMSQVSSTTEVAQQLGFLPVD